VIKPKMMVNEACLNRLHYFPPTEFCQIDSKNKLVEWANKDLSVPCKARPEVRVGYNPAPHDLAKKPQSEQEYWVKRRKEENELIEKNIIGGHRNFTGDAVRCYKHTIAYVVCADPKFAEKAIELILDWTETCKKFGLIHENGFFGLFV
jgi:hypothetical protein